MASIVRDGLFFCEGKDEGWDEQVYQRYCPLGFTVKPVAGKRGMANYVRGVLGEEDPVGKRWVALRDRDLEFEPDPDEEVCVQRRDKWRIYTTHRTCIENYLIDPRVVRRYWAAMAGRGISGFGAPPPLADMQAALRGVAQTLLSSQAFFWAEERLRRHYMRQPWHKVTLEALRQRPGGLAGLDGPGLAAQLVAGVPTHREPVAEEAARAEVDAFMRRFEDPAFLPADGHLVWFHGKHLLDEARRTLKAWPLTKGDLEHIAKHHIEPGDFPDLDTFGAGIPQMPAYAERP